MSRYRKSTVRYTVAPGSRVDAWHRFSNVAQDDASAISAITRHCAEQSWTIDRWWGKPATSGSVITGTREFLDFIAAMEERPEAERRQHGIVVWKLNRLGRDQVESEYYTAHLRRLGYAVISIADPATSSDIQPVLEAFTRWKDQKLLEDISTDVKRTMAWLREDGYSTGGRPPRGFVAVHEENRSKPRKFNGEKRVNARWVRGGPNEDATLLAWQMRVRGATNQEIHAATHLLKDVHCYHDMWRRRCYVEAGYVSEADWTTIQREMDSRAYSALHPRRLGSAYLLSGLLMCACGRPMTGWSIPRGHGEKCTDAHHPGPDAFSYYRCMAAKRGEGCTMAGMVRSDTVEVAVVRAVSTDILTDANLAQLRERVAAQTHTQAEAVNRELAVLHKQRKRTKAAIDNLTHAVETGGSDVAPLVATLRERTAELQILQTQIDGAEALQRETDVTIISDEMWGELVTWVKGGLAGSDADERRRILRSIVTTVDIWPGRDGVTIHYALAGCGLWVVSPQVDHHRPYHPRVFTLSYPCRLLRGKARV